MSEFEFQRSRTRRISERAAARPRIVTGGTVHQDGRSTGQEVDRRALEDLLTEVEYAPRTAAEKARGEGLESYMREAPARVVPAGADLRGMNRRPARGRQARSLPGMEE